ncbi:hypothetical protein G6F57_018971 [Rhizopus arrhizus]|nr:hypothetical protein G6F57_018971 [Rhizopus arrhizus]
MRMPIAAARAAAAPRARSNPAPSNQPPSRPPHTAAQSRPAGAHAPPTAAADPPTARHRIDIRREHQTVRAQVGLHRLRRVGGAAHGAEAVGAPEPIGDIVIQTRGWWRSPAGVPVCWSWRNTLRVIEGILGQVLIVAPAPARSPS